MANCIFCKQPLTKAERAREDVIPVWLQKEWNLKRNQLTPTHFDSHGNSLSKREHNVGDLLAGEVCRSCNNGWMSGLENECRPLILALAGGRRRINELADKEALSLARWAVKTAYALHSASNYRQIVDETHYQILDQEQYRLPPGVVVLGHTYKCGRDIYWMQATGWVVRNLDGKLTKNCLKTVHEAGYKISLRFGGLFLSVIYNPLPDARICLWLGRHFSLYPRWRGQPCCWMRPDRAWPSNMDKRLIAFHMGIGLILADWSRQTEQADINDRRTWTKLNSEGPMPIIRSDDLIGE
jgi:hypothetical protein